MRAYAVTFVVVLALTIVATALLIRVVGQPMIGIDDANIFFSYAKNVAGGRGCVYAGNNETVEGFTSLLWMLLCAAAFAISSSPELLLLGVSCVLASATIVNASRLLPKSATLEKGEMPWGWIVLLFVGLCFANPGFWVWTTVTLMDTCLWSFWLVTGTGCFAFAAASAPRIDWQGSIGCSACVAGSLLSRPEAMMLAMVWMLTLAIAHWMAGSNWRLIIRAVAPMLATFAIVLSGLLCFRLFYFGYPLPNTYYAKVSNSLPYNLKEGLIYLARYLKHNPVSSLVVLCAVPSFSYELIYRIATRISQRQTGESFASVQMDLMLFSGICGGAAPAILTGGDHFALSRFLQPVWPLVVVFGLRTLVLPGLRFHFMRMRVQSSLGYSTIIGLGLVSSALVTSIPSWLNLLTNPTFTGEQYGLTKEFDLARRGRFVGSELNRIFQDVKKPRIGVIIAGGIAVTYDGPIDDLMGLNHVEMAHSPGSRTGTKNHASFNRFVFFKMLPDIIVHCNLPKPGGHDAEGFLTNVVKGLFNDREFREKYTPVAIEVLLRNGENEEALKWWVRNDMLPELKRLPTINVRVIDISSSDLRGAGLPSVHEGALIVRQLPVDSIIDRDFN